MKLLQPRLRMPLFTLVLLLSLSAGTLAAQSDSDTIATVRLSKTDVILGKEYNSIVKRLGELRGNLSQDERKQVLQQLIDNRLILQAANRDRITVTDSEAQQYALQLISSQAGRALTDAEMRQMVQEQGLGYQDFINEAKNNLIMRKFVEQKYGSEINKVAMPSAQDIDAYYNANLGQFAHNDLIKFEQILVQFNSQDASAKAEIKKKADDLFARVRDKGEKIADLAPLYSDDPQSKQRNGDVSYVPRGIPQLEAIFGKNFFDKLFALKVGDLSLIESNVGYHIVRITDRKPKGLYSLDDKIPGAGDISLRNYLSQTLQSQLKNQKLEELVKQHMVELRKEASINILYKQLAP